jgi:ATP/maltotriose-dependent transcriptional regulator MalT
LESGKSVLLSSWAAARGPGVTPWMSCDQADRDPVRFWSAFIEAPRAVAPGFGADAADLLAMDRAMSADVTASIANDAAALLREIDAANLFLVALDEQRTVFRFHHLVRQVLRAELRARDRDREQVLRVRAAEWFEAAGETRHAARFFLMAGQVDRALGLLQDRVVPDFLRDPALTVPLDLSVVEPSLLAQAPDRLLGLAADLLLSGDWVRGGEYLDLVEHASHHPRPSRRLIEHAAQLRPDPYAGRLTTAALEVSAAPSAASSSYRVLAEPLTAAEERILKLLPTSTYVQIAGTLYISRNTVKTHLRSIYAKLGVTSRSEAIERAVDLRLL